MKYYFYLLFLFSTFFSNSFTANWQDYPQPIGTLVRLWDVTGPLPLQLQPPSRIPPFTTPATPVEEVNYITAQWDFNIMPDTVPFDTSTAVTEIIPIQALHFVRVYNPSQGGSPNGPWLTRSSEVRGLTPEQIKDKLALPTLPTNIVNVDLPPSPTSGKKIGLWTGIAAPIAGFGNGGGLQTRIIADFNGTNYFPDYMFVVGQRDHPQLIGEFALSYQPMAGNGITGRVATYLDTFIPIPYSDLENVYTYLDYLNWINFGPDPLRDALKQISPYKFNSLPFVIERNSLLLANTIFDSMDSTCCCTPTLQFQAIGEWGDFKSPHTNFTTAGVVSQYEQCFCSDLKIGIALVGFNNNLNWKSHGGNSSIRSVKLAIYSRYLYQFQFFDSLLTSGYDWLSTRRKIEFLGVNRRARAHQNGFDFSYHVQTGHTFSCFKNTNLIPLARLSYFYERISSFKEHGADSLDLGVKSFYCNTLRSYLELCSVGIGRNNVDPEFHLGWAHYFPLDKRQIQSEIIEIDDFYSIYGSKKELDTIVIDTAVNINITQTIKFAASYEAEIGSHFYFQMVRLNLNYFW